MRKDILEIVERIAKLDGLKDLSMTTNAQMLGDLAEGLKKSGFDEVEYQHGHAQAGTFP